jgi:hypothetical protein
MPNYASAQAGANPATPPVTAGVAGQAGGYNVTSLAPGDPPLYLFNAESPAAPQSSVAFYRAPSISQGDAGISFQVFFSAAVTTATVLIQASEVDNDANYATVNTLTFTASGTSQFYTDIGRSKYYRAQLSAVTGQQPLTVIASR